MDIPIDAPLKEIWGIFGIPNPKVLVYLLTAQSKEINKWRGDHMTWPEKRQDDMESEHAEEKIMKYKKTLFDSGLLERIEKRRLELKQETAHNFDLYPLLNYRGSMDSDHFLKEFSFLHTQYSVDRSGCYSSFCIEVKANGIYWVKSGKNSKKLNPENISDQEIQDWYRSLGK